MILTFRRCCLIILVFLCVYVRKLIFREIILIILVVILSLQSSSLWRTLIVVPIRLILIYSFRRLNIMSGLLIVIYVIVFVGGLLIFLMSVASISPQEQSLRIRVMFWVAILSLLPPILSFVKKLVPPLRWIILSIWFWGEMIILFILGVILVVTLFIVTKFFIVYKGFIRSI